MTFDPHKDQRNIEERGLSFDRVRAFEWESATIQADCRHDYGEDRYIALGYLDGRLHVLAFTPRDEDIRVISLRRANARERAAYAGQTRPLHDR